MLENFPFAELHNWYKSSGRHDLPWRDYNYDAKQLGYRVWLAETMLQQTQVERVKDYFHNILEAFPTVEDLAKASYEEFFPYYKGLGYYSRARNMLKAAKMVSEEFDGVFPSDSSDLVKLPGVGPYTAEAIRAFAYNIPTLSFDTNLEKIFSRYFFGNKFRKLTKQEKLEILESFQNTIKIHQKQEVQGRQEKSEGSVHASTGPKTLSKSDDEIRSFSCICSRDVNNALMDYGATISLNNISGIDWDNYPFKNSEFYKTRGNLEPVKEKKKSSFPTRKAHIVAVLHENHKIYFSKDTDFSAFYIGNSGNPRKLTQDYFLKKYGLEVSVRPPEIKSYNTKELPYMLCYCQIQSGTHNFHSFENLKVRGYEEGYIEEMEF